MRGGPARPAAFGRRIGGMLVSVYAGAGLPGWVGILAGPGAPPAATGESRIAPASVAAPINTAFAGLTTFRGNATRDYYGEGPLPRHPTVLWRYPASGGLCSRSSDLFGTETWCGTGWTGQPNVVVHKDGKIEIREGAYDDN